MKYIVEWGIPALDAPPAGRFGDFTCATAKDAARLAHHVAWTHCGAEPSDMFGDIRRSNCPRVHWWNSAKSFWVSISKLDGIPRGPAWSDPVIGGK